MAGEIWRVSWQDYRAWRTMDLEQPRPGVIFRDFTDKAEAERELRLQRAAGMTACLSEYVLPTKTNRQRQARRQHYQGQLF